MTFPRLLGGLATVWGGAVFTEFLVTGEEVWAGIGLLWLGAAGHLMFLQRVPLASVLILALIGLEFVLRTPQLTGLELMAWLALIVATTEGHPKDRALLLRTCASVVYAFVALSKLNPSWLAGDGLVGLVTSYDHLAMFRSVVESPGVAVTMAVAVICLEGWMAIGLWHRRTRTVTAVVGVLLHLGLVAVASTNVWAVVHLSVFNFGLVACYPAFWAEYRRLPRSGEVPASATA